MIELNKDYKVIINDTDSKGNGVTRIDNTVIFVPYALLNEELTIRIVDIKKRFAIGKIINIEKESKSRCKILCDSYYNCGGCSFLHSSYDEEINKKREFLENKFNISLDKVYSNEEYNYRNKATFHVSNNRIGYYSENTHEIVEFNKCMLLDNRINDIYNILKRSNLNNITKVIVRVTSNELMVIFDNNFDYKELLNNYNVDSIYISDKCVFGKKYITEEINGIKYTIYPDSFFQINTVGINNLYNTIREYCGSGDKLLDLYCGTGSIGIYLKDKFKSIIGIEVNKSSILNANLNKDINNIPNIKFILGDSKIASKDNYDIIIVDPPRSGLSNSVINFLNNSKSKIIYVSCNPDTLKRDTDLLSNYTLEKISMVNMFPKTKHVETVCLLSTNI